MKKLVVPSMITMFVGLALVLVAGVLRSIGFDTTTFNPATLANTLFTLGYLIAVLSGIIVAANACVNVIKGNDIKKLIVTSGIIAIIGFTLVLLAGVLGTVQTWGNISTTVGAFNPTGTNGLNSAFSTIGYLAATLAGVILVAGSVASAAKEESKK